MIVKMKHVTVLSTVASERDALRVLRELGIIHLSSQGTEKTSTVPEAEAAIARRSAAEKAIAILGGIKKGDKKSDAKEAAATPEEVVSLAGEISLKEESLRLLQTEIDLYGPFGDFDPETASRLQKDGIEVCLFASSPERIPEKEESESLTLLGRDKEKNLVYGVIVGAGAQKRRPEAIPLPKKPLSEMKREFESLAASCEEDKRRLASFADSLPSIREELARRKSESQFLAALASMQKDGAVSWITGFAPEKRLDALRRRATTEGWALLVRDPLPGEHPPTLLEPIALFRPITTLFGLLGISPGYYEADVSVVFYAFFTIFFAMLVGDAGYGAVMLLLALVFRKKLLLRSSAPFILLCVFSISTIVWGVLSATYFAIPKECLPQALLFRAGWFSNANVMQLCFFLGAAHLSVARIWNFANLFPDSRSVAELGWVGIIWTMYSIACKVSVEGFAMPGWIVPLAAISALAIFLFMLKRDELKTSGISLAILPLNIMSCLGDIISYIRLFAVGLASVKVAENFNEMALSLELSPILKIPAVILILLLGHGLNFVMAALSILVHAVRLNTLEFSNHKGVSWSGFAYEPFRK